MANKKISICIIDDSLPFHLFINEIETTALISSETLIPLLSDNIEWPDERDLKLLTNLLLNSSFYLENKITLKWALHPGICVNAIDKEKYSPDLIIYDWEYKNSAQDSADLLGELITKLPDTFFFVYSNRAQEIPILMFKSQLDAFANRFQLLPKGNHRLILSSEELIYSYTALYIDDHPYIKIGTEKVHFDKSNHLVDYKDILHLEFILGKESLKTELKKAQNKINEITVKQMLEDFNYNLFLSKDEKTLVGEESEIFKKRFGPLSEISYADVFEKYGLHALSAALNTGTYKIN